MEPVFAEPIGGTIRQRAVRALRDRILTGAIPAGSRIDLDQISAEFGISKTPVREALLELSFQGLVTIAPRSGVTVIGASNDTVVDNFAVLAVLSGTAAAWAAERIDDDDLAEMFRLVDVMDALDEGEALAFANWQFHRLVNRCSGSPRLISHLRQAVRLIPSNFRQVVQIHGNDEHRALAQALKQRHVSDARSIAENHVLEACTYLMKWLSERQGRTDSAIVASAQV